MSRYQVTPNMLIVPPQLLLYMALAPEEKIKYVEGGEKAVANFDAGVAGYESRAFRGLGVFSSMPYEVSDGMRRTLLFTHVLECASPLLITCRACGLVCLQTRTPSRCSSAAITIHLDFSRASRCLNSSQS